MVNAQQARRFLDRFVGYQLSPLLWKKVGARNLSAGRVQSVAVRLIADRERDIRAFVTEEYWKIAATVSPAGSTAVTDQFKASLAEYDGAKFEAKTEAEAHAVRDALQSVPYSVAKVDETEKLDRADAPFKTSTLQQQAAIRLRFSGKKTMKVAQELYEGIDVDGSGPVGLITYMRTDSLRVSDEAMTAVREQDQERVRRALLARQADPLRRRQEWPRRPTRPFAPPTSRFTPDRIKGTLEPRPVPALSAHLRPVRRQPDGPRRLHGHRRLDRGRRRHLQGSGQGAEVRRPPAGLAARRQAGRRAAAGPCRRPGRSTCTASTRPSISPSRRRDTARPRSSRPWKKRRSAAPAPTRRSSRRFRIAATSSRKSGASTRPIWGWP